MKWFEYKQEVDALHASDDLKARLLAMQDGAPAQDAARRGFSAAGKKPRKPIRLPLKRIAAIAAYFAVGVVCCDVFGWSVMPRAGSSGSFMATAGASAADTAMSEAGSADGSYGWYAMDSVSDPEASAAEPAAQELSGEKTRAAERKVIYTAYITLESKEYDATLAALEQAAADAGGYAESRSEQCYNQNSRYISLVFRIPAAQYEAFLAAAGDAGSVVKRSETADDITAAYLDVSARVQALTTQRDRLLELSAQADTLSDLLEIENQLTEVQYQLESYESRLNYYDDQVDYCTVNVDLEEVQVYTPVETSFAAQLGEQFVGAIWAFGAFFADLVLWLVGCWPWLVLIGIVAAIVITIRRKRRT